MESMSVREAAQRWGISERRVQDYCRAGRIDGVARYGKSWVLPQNAPKPVDPRQRRGAARPPKLFDGLFVLANVRFDRREISQIIAELPSEEERAMARSEYAFFCGRSDEAVSASSKQSWDASPYRLMAIHGGVIVAIQRGDYAAVLRGMAQIEALKAEYRDDPAQTRIIELSEGTITASIYAADSCPDWVKAGDLSLFSERGKAYAFYVYARYLHAMGQRDRMMGVAEAALTFYAGKGFTITELYLRLMHALARVERGENEEARRELKAIYALALPYGLISPIAEQLINFRGEAERVLRADFPEWEKPVVQEWRKVIAGWLEIHNRILKTDVTKLLTLRESQIALYLSDGLSYKEIADKMDISYGSVNTTLQIVREKLGVKSSRQIKECIRWLPENR